MGWRDTEDGCRELVFRVKDPISALTHFLGLLAALAGGFPLLIRAALHGRDLADLLSLAAFVGGLILLYGASSAYHTFTLSLAGIKRLKKLDHAMIYLLIAGSYAPVCRLGIGGETGTRLLAVVSLLALAGCAVTLFWVDCPKWVSSLLYIGLGWACVFALPQIMSRLAGIPLALLAGGGILYTVGGVIYALHIPLPCAQPGFGNHEVFHLFVLAGSLCHYLMIFFYLA
ncbi:MAG: hemolysin III family protein [Bacteroidales bacterium]|nr:hemolysin III family protein [Bacteroidales bacterium]